MSVRPLPKTTLERALNADQLFCSVLQENDWTFLRTKGRVISFAKGATIFLQGSKGDSIYVVRSGRVEISIGLADGRKAILNQMGPGEVFGEIAVLDGGSRSADAIAASDDVVLDVIAQSQVIDLLNRSPAISVALIRELCLRVRNASDMFEVKSEKSARVRLARSLLRVAAKWGRADNNGTVLTGFSQADLGELAGLARENVNRQMKMWEMEGLLRIDGESITLVDADEIADQALI